MFFMFKIHHVLMLELLALAAGTAILMWAHKEECCRKFFKAIGYFIIVVSFLTIICTAYQAVRMSCERCHGGMKMQEMGGMPGMWMGPGIMPGMGPRPGMMMDGPMMKPMPGAPKTETAPAPIK